MPDASKGAVLVTGGAGFVGSHIANRLARNCTPVHVIDDLSTGDRRWLGESVVFHRGDICKEADVSRLLGSIGFEAVVHCAAQTSVARSMAEPALDWRTNVLGTRTLVRAAKGAGVRRFVFMSSGGAIYGETTEPATESTLPSPRSHYGLNKFAAEQIVRAEAISHAILRPSNIFGPGQRSDLEGGVVAIFVERLLRGEPVELHGNGQQRRDFVHVSDVVSAVELALRVHDDVIWNVASGRSIQIVELLKTLARLTGAGTGLQRMPRRPGDVRTSALSAALLRSRGWGPPLGLQAGLELLLAEEAGGTAIDKTFSGSVVC